MLHYYESKILQNMEIAHEEKMMKDETRLWENLLYVLLYYYLQGFKIAVSASYRHHIASPPENITLCAQNNFYDS